MLPLIPPPFTLLRFLFHAGIYGVILFCEFFMRHNIPCRERYPGTDSALETLGHDILRRAVNGLMW